jgi:hypothetical protein
MVNALRDVDDALQSNDVDHLPVWSTHGHDAFHWTGIGVTAGARLSDVRKRIATMTQRTRCPT